MLKFFVCLLDLFENNCVSIDALFVCVMLFVSLLYLFGDLCFLLFFYGLMLYSCRGNFHRRTARLSLIRVGIDDHSFGGSVEWLTHLCMSGRMAHLWMIKGRVRGLSPWWSQRDLVVIEEESQIWQHGREQYEGTLECFAVTTAGQSW